MSRVLIADDIAENRYLLEVILRASGHEVTSTANGAEALASAQQNPPDLVIADILMPVLDGFELCRRWKADERLRPIPFVFYTATYVSQEDEAFALSLGAERFLVKPLQADQLMQAVREVLAAPRQATVPDVSPAAAAESLRQYNEVLFHKLEKKVEELESARKLLQDVFQSMGEGLAVVGPDYRIRLANAAYGALVGVEAAGLAGMTCYEATCEERRPCDDSACGCPVRESFSTGAPSLSRDTRTARGGERVATEVRSYPIKGESGEVTAVIEIVRDISEGKRAEEALRASEERYRMLFATSPDALLVYEVGTGRFLDANPAASRLYGYPPEELLRLTNVDISAEPEETIRAAREGAELVPIRYHRKKDGTVFPVEITASYREQEGRPVSLISIRDIGPRLRAEEDLRRLTAAVEQAAESVVITDTEGAMLYANPAFERITGYTREEALGKKPSLLKSGKHPPEFYRELWETIRGGESWVGRFVNRRKDGTLYEEDAVISPVRDRAGTIVNYVAVKRDVTEEVALRSQLEQAQKMEAVGRLAGGIAHDFNNLLTVILGRADLALGAASTGEAVRADLEEIQSAAERAAALTNQLLIFSRKQVLQPTTVDLSDVVESAGKFLKRLIGADIEVVAVLSKELPAVRVDPGQMEQVILNLGVNARDAMPRGGRLTIETSEVFLDEGYAAHHSGIVAGRYVMLAVSDTGTGMDAETRARIFEPFFTTKEAGKGTGLGLSIVHGIVKQSGGSIWVYSEVGEGTTFKIYLPPDLERTGFTPAATPIAARGGDERILVVEDEAPVRRLAVDILRSGGYEILEASGGDEALSLLSKATDRIHLLLTDFVMPRMTGRELADRVREARPGIKVLYMSGYTSSGFPEQAVPEPFDFLPKPFTKAALAAKVREVLDRT